MIDSNIYIYKSISTIIYMWNNYYILTMIIPPIIYYFYNKHLNTKPKQYKKYDKITIQHNSDNNRDGFSKKKIPQQIDCIIIGSGMGGLTTAGLLARCGKKVLVLEQHYIAGGSTHCFVENGFEFDTGVHYIGNIKKRNKILDIITKNKIEWAQLGRDNNSIYDNLIINENKYSFQAGASKMIKYLCALFPKEKINIVNYINYVQKVAKMELFFLLKIVKPIFLARFLNYIFCAEFRKISNKSVKQVLDEFFTNNRLKAVIAGLSIDGGPVPTKQSFFIHASILNHYIEGGFYPSGGCGVISQNIIPVIEEAGGRVLVRAPVSNIIVKNNKAIGVKCRNIEIYANTVVSSVGLRNTYLSLLPQNIPQSTFYNDVFKTIPSQITYNFLFIGFDIDGKELGFNSSNMYIWPEESFDKAVEKYEKDPFSGREIPPMFIASNSAKDPTWNKRYPNKSTVCVIAWSNTKMFNSKGSPNKKREELYLKNKEAIEKMMWNELYKHFPKCKNHIKYISSATGETVKHYLGSYEGECYGLDATCERFNFFDMKPKTNIDNLYLTGQDIVASGFAGAMTSGILTASDILGYGTLEDILFNRNIITDIQNLN